MQEMSYLCIILSVMSVSCGTCIMSTDDDCTDVMIIAPMLIDDLYRRYLSKILNYY